MPEIAMMMMILTSDYADAVITRGYDNTRESMLRLIRYADDYVDDDASRRCRAPDDACCRRVDAPRAMSDGPAMTLIRRAALTARAR